MTVMILMLVALMASAVFGMVMLQHQRVYDSFLPFMAFALLVAISIFGLIGLSITAWSWVQSDYKAQIINREYGTDYTREEVFFAADVIDTVRELDRKRIEINGDIFTGKERAK